MDERMLNAQCRDFANCINELSLTLLEAGSGNDGISKIVSDVHKLIQSFRLLGNHYVGELVKKCRELETKNQEVKELWFKLERRAETQNPENVSEVDGQHQTGRESQAEEPAKQQDGLDKRMLGPYSKIVQELDKSSEELKKSLTDLHHSKRVSGDSHEDTGPRGCNKRHMEIIDVSSDSEVEEVEQVKGDCTSRPLPQTRRLNSDFEVEGVKGDCTSGPLPKTRRLNGTHVIDTQGLNIKKEIPERMKNRLEQEESMVNGVSKLLGDYQHAFLDQPSACNGVNFLPRHNVVRPS